MFIWEMVAHRLRRDGWLVWHQKSKDTTPSDATYIVHIHRPGVAWRASGSTLTEAFAAAARKAREDAGTRAGSAGPHFRAGLGAVLA